MFSATKTGATRCSACGSPVLDGEQMQCKSVLILPIPAGNAMCFSAFFGSRMNWNAGHRPGPKVIFHSNLRRRCSALRMGKRCHNRFLASFVCGSETVLTKRGIIWFELVCAWRRQHLGGGNPTARMKPNRILPPILAAVLLSLASSAAPADSLEAGFRNPPDSAKPQTWWHWMNGNITKAGITADLEAMKQIGLGGATIVNVDCGIPRGPVNFMSPEWRDGFQIRRARRPTGSASNSVWKIAPAGPAAAARGTP